MSYSMFKSRTVWVFLFMFIVGGVNATTNVLPSSIVEPLMALLALLGSYFHVNPSQVYNQGQIEG
jgi:hypothetical protein